MALRTLKNGADLHGKRVLVRIDGNVPVVKGKAVDGAHGRIARAAVGIDWLRQRGARVIVMTHLGRPKGKRVPAYSVRPVAKRLSELLGIEVRFSRDIVGPSVSRAVDNLKDGEVLLLENVRFDAREERNSPAFAQSLASLADLYVNDAFGVCHRAHASVEAIAEQLPSYAGPLLQQEVSVLSKVMKSPKRPFVLALGGLKASDKIPVMRKLLPDADYVIVGGALATAFLAADGLPVGRSVYDGDGVRSAKRLLKDARVKFLLPLDVVVASSPTSRAKKRNVSVSQVGPKDMILDIGHASMKKAAREVEGAKTVVWNGPFGLAENERFRDATLLLARAVADRAEAAVTVVGGGDTVPLVERAGLADRFTLLSTGGGAMLEFLAGKKMPGIEALQT
ncbi:phosphoglycerate kinase [Candidatus Uhrbacteria bacterium RIFCSPHIGHO2_01_FULL_63_20]|uniref:Phosphoglycerate kinase n=1 Tax=Candidatus Uhrbacteria bacterium RIFCSPHIGHO2_01_FULL_63_20 TaxID=1802385 RepID=A0A1F7TL84_9BACT|nr:MAG: phosphoglycerate kinase [Candidatus Uhrbacteria bacterium RIFCSPHIGHO2_01_FULL_63_20]